MAEQKFKTSFIPKKPVSTVSSGGKIKKKGSDLFTLVSFVIFIVMIVVAVGTYFYKIKLEADVQGQVARINEEAENIDRNFIDQVIRLDTRISTVKKLLDKHLAPTQLFSVLEENTYKTVKFNNLSYSLDGKDVILSGSGIAAGYESIVLQSDQYGKAGLRDVIFSGLQNNEQGLVTFSFSSKMSIDEVLYRDDLDMGQDNQRENSQNESSGSIQTSENMENGVMVDENNNINNQEQ
ncbi:hypothetical protein GW764_03195 [Candidatus Parcubacteria bacterium]|nr:hypothetical protein [Candidatus Parcubacteria bacterium]